MRKAIYIFISVPLFISFVTPALAQNAPYSLKRECTVGIVKFIVRQPDGKTTYVSVPVTGVGDIATIDCIPYIIANVVFWALAFSGSVAIFLIIFAGIKFLTSGGDPKQVEGARKTVTWAIIGLIIIILSFAIVAIIAQITGVGCITKFGFTQCL